MNEKDGGPSDDEPRDLADAFIRDWAKHMEEVRDSPARSSAPISAELQAEVDRILEPQFHAHVRTYDANRKELQQRYWDVFLNGADQLLSSGRFSLTLTGGTLSSTLLRFDDGSAVLIIETARNSGGGGKALNHHRDADLNGPGHLAEHLLHKAANLGILTPS